MATITSLGMTIWSKFDGRGFREAHREVEKFDGTMRNINQSFTASVGRTNMLRTSLLALAPAVATLGTAAVGAGASVGASLGAAGAAAGAYGLVVAKAVERTMELRKEGAALSSAQMGYIRTLDRFKDTWSEFLTSRDAKVLSVARDGIDGLTAGIRHLGGIVDDMHPMVKRTSNAFKEWMEGDGSKRFADTIRTYGVPAMDDLVEASRNFLAVGGHMFRDMIPLSNGFTDAIRRGSEAMRAWAEGGGFVRFMEQISANGPQIREFFTALWQALKRLLEATAGLAPAMLGLLTIFLQIIANTPVEVLQALYITLVSLKIVQAVATGFGAFAASLTFLLTPAGWVVAALALVGAGLVYLKTNTDFFETQWPGIWQKVKESAEPTFTWIIDTIQTLGEVFGRTFRSIKALVNGDYQGALDAMKTGTDANSTYVQDSWNALYVALRDDVFRPFFTTLGEEWNVWLTHMSSDLKETFEGMTKEITEEYELWKQKTTEATEWISKDYATMWGRIAGDNAVQTAQISVGIGSWLDGLKTRFGTGLAAIRDDWSEEFGLMGSRFGEIFTGTKIFANVWWQDIKSLFGQESAEVGSNWDSEWTSNDTTARGLWNGLKIYFGTWWTDVKSNFGTSLGQIRANWDHEWSLNDGTLRSLWIGLQTYFGAWWTDVKSNFGTSLGQIRANWDHEWSLNDGSIRSLWTGLGIYFGSWWEGVKSTFQGGLDWLKGPFWSTLSGWLLGDLVNAFTTAVDSIKVGWAAVKDWIRDPIQKVIDIVYNQGIVSMWNTVAKTFGGSQLETYTMPQWRDGGPVHGPGTTTSDSIVGRLSRDEHVWTAKEVRAAGGHEQVAKLRSYVLGGKGVRTFGDGQFAEGGGVGDWISSRIDDVKQAVRGGIYKVLEPVMSGVKNIGTGIVKGLIPGDDTNLELASVGFVNKPVDTFLDWIKGADTPITGSVMGWRNMWELVQKNFPDATLTSGLRTGDQGYHGKGQAIDVAWPMNRAGMDRMLTLNKWIASEHPNAAELIHTPGINLRMGKPFTYNALTRQQHHDHVHWATDDFGNGGGLIGGKVPTGERLNIINAALRATGVPPPNSAGQWQAGLNTLIERESGWNSRAVNNWDSNAKSGIPSGGLAQVIGPTFAAHRVPWLPNDVFHPVANVAAAVKYIVSRYGGITNVQQANANMPPKGYARGTWGATAGIHTVAENGAELITRGPTPVRFRGGEKVWSASDTENILTRRSSGDTVINVKVDARGSTKEAAEILVDKLPRELEKILKQGPGKRIGG